MTVNFLGHLKQVKANKNDAETKEKIEQGLYYDVSEIDAKMKLEKPAIYTVNHGFFINDNYMKIWTSQSREDKEKLDSLRVDYDILQKKYDILLKKYNEVIKNKQR